MIKPRSWNNAIRPGETLMDGVREYNEGLAVYFAPTEDCPEREDERAGRFVIEARNEGGHNSTAVDVQDMLAWLAQHKPEMLIDALNNRINSGQRAEIRCYNCDVPKPAIIVPANGRRNDR